MMDNSVHVVPVNDYREHELTNLCWCNPVEDEEETGLFIHNALDQRERFEEKGHDA